MAHLPGSANLKQFRAAILAPALQAFIFVVTSAVATFGQDALTEAPAQDDGFLSMVFSTYGIAILVILAVVGLIVARKIRRRRKGQWEDVDEEPAQPAPAPNEILPAPRNQTRRREDQAALPVRQSNEPASGPATSEADSGFGAYRVDQEVSKLVIGKPHRLDVMASRAADDRRAIEASLVKALNTFETDEDGKQRAREALQDYGFLAQQSAILLMGRDAWQRSSAARMLGEVRSPASLPFLIEALHDTDVVVRNQAVASLGRLKLPTAIGALLDIAQRHPDIPTPLLSEALSACSVDTLPFLDLPSFEPAFASDNKAHEERSATGFTAFTDLPDGSDDPALADVLKQLQDEDARARAQAAQLLGSYAVQSSVLALTSSALSDPDSSVRAAAVSSLGSIDHESVFAAVLIALSDESREVRASAARALTSLRFDRGHAYARVMETGDQDTLRSVARACVQIGIVTQALDRLNCEDRRQAHEAFTLVSLLAKANETDPIIHAIETHPDENLRLSLVRVLPAATQPELAPRLRELVASEKISENVRTALLEVLYKLDQIQATENILPGDNIIPDVA